MSLVILGGAVLLLLLLIAKLKWNAFLALIFTAFVVGLANRMSLDATLKSVLKGVGDTMGAIALVIVFGAILGKMIEESGAARAITRRLVAIFGERRIQIAVFVTGLLVGLPMVYNASFLVLIPLVYALSAETGLPLLYLGIPLSAALSSTHGFLPPHPAPTTIAALYGANANTTLLYGLLLAVPAAVLAGPVLARFFRDHNNTPPPELYTPVHIDDGQLPGAATSLLVVLAPVLLMASGADATVAMLGALLFSFLVLRRGASMETLMKRVSTAATSVSMVLLIIAAGGAFKQVLLDAGTGNAIQAAATAMPVSPIVLAWSVSALLRLALGSATVAAITAAGILVPLVPGSGVAPELLVLATASGSLMFSHFNDIGFWMFKEYYNASLRQTFQIWTVMESLVAVAGLCGTLLFAQVLPARAEARPAAAVYVNSYHPGYPSSDDIAAAIGERFAREGIPLEIVYLDGKRDPAQLVRRASAIAARLKASHPAVLIASDDDAVKYVVAPHFRNGPFPVVFCGVNWSASQYGLPTGSVTGMLEMVPIDQALAEIRKQYPAARRLAVLSEDSVSERSNTALLAPRYAEAGFTASFRLVSDFEAWKREYLEAQQQADAVYLPTNGAIRGWNAEEARRFVAAQTSKPTFTCDDFMLPYAAFGLTKVAREHGEWAASAAVAILRGAKPSSISLATNREIRCLINPVLARKVRFQTPAGLACRIAG